MKCPKCGIEMSMNYTTEMVHSINNSDKKIILKQWKVYYHVECNQYYYKFDRYMEAKPCPN